MFGFLVFDNKNDKLIDWVMYETKEEMLEWASRYDDDETVYLEYFITHTKEEIEKYF